MKLLLLNINKGYKRKKLESLPDIRNFSSKYNSCNISFTNNNKSSNSINQTTKASLSKNNSSISLINKGVKKLKKIKLNNSMNCVSDFKSYFPKTNTNKTFLKLLKNADEIIKIRNSANKFAMVGGKNFSRFFNVTQGKEISKTNYSIDFLRKKRTEISLKNYLMEQAVINFNIKFDKDYQEFHDFISIKEEDILGKVIKIREKTESILNKEKSLNDLLQTQIKNSVKTFFALQKFGEFFHEIIETPFLYSQIPNKISVKFNYEDVANAIINLYEKEEKYNKLNEKLNNENLFMSKYLQMEDLVLFMIDMKRALDIEIKNEINNFKKESKLIYQMKEQYERELKFYKEEKNLIDLDLKKNNIYAYSNLDDILNFIVELGLEVGVKGPLPKKKEQYFDEFIPYAKSTMRALEKMENEINKYIDSIEKIIEEEKSHKKNIINEIILNQKNSNKLEFKMSFKQIQEKIKLEKDMKTFEKAKKLVLKGRIVYKLPSLKHNKTIKIIEIKEENKDDELYYSDTEKEVEEKKDK